MIFFIGDIHGDFSIFDFMKDKVAPNDTIIQVGDFGFYPETLEYWKNDFPCKVFAIEGNHEDFNLIRSFNSTLTEVRNKLFYVPRGTVLEIEGKLIGFLGGAESVDKFWRKENVSWWPQERVTDADLDNLIANVSGRQLDVLVTHAPPASTISVNFPRLDPMHWNLPLDWIDMSAIVIERANKELNPKLLICGHMHAPVRYSNVKILDINEVVMYR